MKKGIISALAALLLITSATALVGHNNTDGDLGIASTGSTASATTAVGPNGTKFSSKVSMLGDNRSSTADRITDEKISSSKVSFKGTVQAMNPCQGIEQNVTETENGYVMNIRTVAEETGNETERTPCAQVITGINYDAEFEAETGFGLEVQHNGNKIKEFQTVSDKGEKNKKKSWLERILSFIGL